MSIFVNIINWLHDGGFDLGLSFTVRRLKLRKRSLGSVFSEMKWNEMKWNNYISTIVSNANEMLGMLLKTFTSRDLDLLKMMYISLVKPWVCIHRLKFIFERWYWIMREIRGKSEYRHQCVAQKRRRRYLIKMSYSSITLITIIIRTQH